MLPNYDNSTAPSSRENLHPQPNRRSANGLRGQIYEISEDEKLAAAPIDLDIEVADLLPQRVAVQPQQVRRSDLVAPCRRQSCREQRHLDLLKDAVIKARRRHAVWEAGEMRGQIGFDRTAEIVDPVLHATAGAHGRRRQ